MNDKEIMVKLVHNILAERLHQKELSHGGDTEAFDKTNTKNDWVAYINAYNGRAADKCFRNEREGQTFRSNMIKVAALALAALEANEKGYC